MKRTLGHFALAVAFGLLSPIVPRPKRRPRLPPTMRRWRRRRRRSWACPKRAARLRQEALVWLGLYVGVNDGDFGKRTRDAILAFQASLKAPADGTLSAPELQALLAAAQKAREAAGFQVVSDPKTGAKIGAPLKLLRALPGARLDFAANADADLGALYARLSAATPARKIAYKAIKPDAFFVVSGQDGPVKFYTRFDKNPPRVRQSAASPSPIRRPRPPISTELRSPSPIHSSRSPEPPGAGRKRGDQRRYRVPSIQPAAPARSAACRDRACRGAR